MGPKRPRATPTDSSQSDLLSQPTPQSNRAKKRARRNPPPPSAPTATTATTATTVQEEPEPEDPPQNAQPIGEAAPDAAASTSADAPAPVQLPVRKVIPGSLRRLSRGHPAATTTNTRALATLAGAKIGGKSKDLRDGAVGTTEEIWVTRRQGALGFGGYLKKACRGVEERGVTTLKVHAMGAAIPLALSLAMAIRDSLPGGGVSSSGSGKSSVISMKVVTGTTSVHDEITPDDEDMDLVYQTRQKSTVDIELKVEQAVADMLGATARGRGAGDHSRGRKRHGASRGRGRGRGRG